jgi:hypothetical protein
MPPPPGDVFSKDVCVPYGPEWQQSAADVQPSRQAPCPLFVTLRNRGIGPPSMGYVMKHGKSALSSLAMLFCSAGVCAAASMSAMQGAWTMEGTECKDIFVSSKGALQFKDKTASTTTGFIVSGSKLRGAAAVCTATKIVQKADRMIVALSCADDIIAGNASVAFKIIDADHFERYDHFFPGDGIRYQRCRP